MRTHPSIVVLVCVIGMTMIARDAEALRVTFDQAREAVSFTEPIDLPTNIAVSPDLEDVVAQMLRESGTFRRQCWLIGRMQRLRVRILLEDPPRRRRAVRAESELTRYEFGGITALVHVWSREDAIELIAHELEHVIEIAEGANYRALSLAEPHSVWTPDGSAFETARAIHVGLQVKREAWLASATLAARR